jgi:hypothetical protein
VEARCHRRRPQDGLSTSAGHLVVAVLETIAVRAARLGAPVDVDIGAPLTRLSVDGGLAKRRALMRAVCERSSPVTSDGSRVTFSTWAPSRSTRLPDTDGATVTCSAAWLISQTKRRRLD